MKKECKIKLKVDGLEGVKVPVTIRVNTCTAKDDEGEYVSIQIYVNEEFAEIKKVRAFTCSVKEALERVNKHLLNAGYRHNNACIFCGIEKIAGQWCGCEGSLVMSKLCDIDVAMGGYHVDKYKAELDALAAKVTEVYTEIGAKIHE